LTARLDGSGNVVTGNLPNALPSGIGEQVSAAAARQGVSPALALAIARNEGGTNRISPRGAAGTMQLMPDTARDLGVNRFNQSENVEGGVRYLRQLLNRFGGDQLAAGAAYNAGPNHAGVQHFAATGDRSRLPGETQGYLSRLEAQGVSGGRSGSQGGEITVRFENAPQGMRVSTTGNVTAERPRVATAMPSTGP
jgi:soluble lytic murein transglycosylase-like protein